MANIKFSAFTQLAPIDQTNSYIVGYEGDANTNNRWTFGEVAIGLKAVTATPYSIYSASGALEATREVTFSAHDLKFIATGNGKLWYQDGNQAAGYVLKSNGDGEASWAAETDTGVTGVTLAIGTGQTSPLAESITNRELTITSNKYGGTNQVGYVPEGGGSTTFLRGDGTWVVPTDTTYTGGTDINISASDVINHDSITNNVTTDGSTLSFGGTFDAIDSVTVSAQGHITAQNTKTYTLPSAQTLPTGADPSATISGTVANGSATTFMRSDAVPALNRTITIGTGGVGGERGLVDIEGAQESGVDKDAQLRLNCSYGTHAVVIEGPQHSGGSNYIIKLPHGAPALNKILKVGTYVANAGTYADPSLATMIWADDTDTSIYSADGNLTADRTVTMNNTAANAPYNLTFAGITTSKVTFSNLGGVEIARDLTVQRNVIIQGQGYSELNAMTANTFAPDWNIGNVQSVTLTQASTFAPTNPKAGATYILIVTNTNAAITWGSYIKWAAPDTQAAPPELSGSGKTDVITLICYDGSTTNGLYYGSITKDLS